MVKRYRVVLLVLIFLALQFWILGKAKAEYRVYRLGIKYEAESPEVEVLTTLDDLQYNTFYRLTSTQKTRLIEHWMCWGRTDNMLAYCDKPIRQPAQSPAPR